MSATGSPPYHLLSESMNPAFPDIPAEDLRRYSLSRAIRIAAGGQSGRGTREQEIHDLIERAVSRVLGPRRTLQGFAVPLDILGALDSGTATEGQELLFTQPGRLIDGLRARSVLGSMGATLLPIRLPFSEPRLDTDVTVTWVGEDPGSDLSDTAPAFGSVDYTLHTLACTVPYSRQLLAQTWGMRSADQVVARAAEAAIATELDRAAIQGSGASNEPTGVLNTAHGTAPMVADPQGSL